MLYKWLRSLAGTPRNPDQHKKSFSLDVRHLSVSQLDRTPQNEPTDILIRIPPKQMSNSSFGPATLITVRCRFLTVTTMASKTMTSPPITRPRRIERKIQLSTARQGVSSAQSSQPSAQGRQSKSVAYHLEPLPLMYSA